MHPHKGVGSWLDCHTLNKGDSADALAAALGYVLAHFAPCEGCGRLDYGFTGDFHPLLWP